MRKVLRISVLVMALALSVNAGVIQNGVTSDPPPPPSVTGEMQNGVTNAGDMQNGISSTPLPAASTATDVFLTLLQSLLTLF
jgi:hypothetical protein